MSSAPDVDRLTLGVLAGDRTLLAQAITRVESRRPEDAPDAEALVTDLLPRAGRSHRIGVSGPPGVGKSTFIEAFGLHLLGAGHRVAVLAVDPSSRESGGSILGDKSRMDRLAQDPRAFIRPSPSDATLGGVARRTREAMVLCEAAGFDRILVETVGVGQSEVEVEGIVDTFLLLAQPGAGDELQGIKRGVLELCDLVVVNKADGERIPMAREALRQLENSLGYQRPKTGCWKAEALSVSALEGQGLAELSARLDAHLEALRTSGEFETRRTGQLERWAWGLFEERALEQLRSAPQLLTILTDARTALESGDRSPAWVASRLLGAAGFAPVEP